MPTYLTDADLIDDFSGITDDDVIEIKDGKAKPAPPRPKKKPTKKPRQPVTAGIFAPGAQASESEATKRAKLFGQELTGPKPEPRLDLEGTIYEVTDLPTAKIDTKKPGLEYKEPITVLADQEYGGPKLKATSTRRRPNETLDAYMKRAAALQNAQKAEERQHLRELAAVRAKTLPKSQTLRDAATLLSPTLGAFLESPGVGKAIGTGLEMVGEDLPISIAQGIGNVLTPTAQTIGNIAGDPDSIYAQDALPRLNQEETDSYINKIAQGIGSTVPFALVSALGGRPATALLGAASNAGQTYKEAIAMGQTHEEALAASVPGALIGSLEGLMGFGSGEFLGKWGKSTVGAFIKDIGEDEFQELSSQLLNTVNAKMLSGYDPDRAITEGLGETFLTTLGTAGLLGAPGLAGGGFKRSGVDFSFGEIPGETAGVELYAGVDPALIRDYLPRPETISKLFKGIFKPGELSGKELADVKNQLAKTKETLRNSIEEKAYKKIQQLIETEGRPRVESTEDLSKALSSYPDFKEFLKNDFITFDQWLRTQTESKFEVDPQNPNQTTGVFSLLGHPEVFVLIPGEVGDSQSMSAMLETAHNELLTQSINFVIANPDLYTQLHNKLDNAYSMYAYNVNKAIKNKVHLEAEKAYRKVNRWADHQVYKAQLKAKKTSKDSPPPLESKLGKSPQGLVVHNISAYNLGRLLAPAQGDPSRAFQPMPSVGVIDPETVFNSFGEITLVGTPQLVEDAVKHGTAYPTDFYTPTVPLSTSVTEETVQGIVREMRRKTSEMMENRWSTPDEVFSNRALFNSFAKAGGSYESLEAIKQGLANLKRGARTDASNPEFGEARGYSDKFNATRAELGDTHPEIASMVDDYLLMTLAKGEDVDASTLTQRLIDLVKKNDPNLSESYMAGLSVPLNHLAKTATEAFAAYRRVPSIYMEMQPARPVALSEYVAALIPERVANEIRYQATIKTLTDNGFKVYVYYNDDEKVKIQKALAQFKDLAVNPDSGYGALYSNPVFDPELWKRAKDAWRSEDPEAKLLRDREIGEDFVVEKTGAEEVATPEAAPELMVDENAASVFNPETLAQPAAPTIEQATEPPNQPPGQPPTSPDEDGPEPPNLYDQVMSVEQFRLLNQEFVRLAAENGFAYNPNKPPHKQLGEAVASGKLDYESLSAAFQAAGLDAFEVADLLEATSSKAGQVLQALSNHQTLIEAAIKKDPKAAAALYGAKKVLNIGLESLEATILGRSWWERAGDIMRKNFLSRLSTTATQIWSATGQLPLSMAADGLAGVGMRLLNPEKWKGTSDAGLMKKLSEDMARGMAPQLEFISNLKPETVTSLVRLNVPKNYQQYEEIINQVNNVHRQVYNKLHGREELKLSDPEIVAPDVLEPFLKQISDPTERYRLTDRLNKLKARKKLNDSLLGKSLKGYEKTLDTILLPLSVQEYAFRKPIFVGALRRELEAKGISMAEAMANPQLIKKNEAEVQAALDEALKATWAYEPKQENKSLGRMDQALEASAANFIKMWNKLGPIGATLEAFPRAFTNGLKFAYEWGPLGFTNPAWEIGKKLKTGHREAITFQETQRIGQAMVGTLMYGVALGLREFAGGEEWWQIKTGKKDAKGQPIYWDARRVPQLAFFLNVADLAIRASKGTMGDIDPDKRLAEVYLNVRRNTSPNDIGSVDYFLKLWDAEDISQGQKAKFLRPIGEVISNPLIPLVNLRDAWAQINEEAGAKRDLREEPIWGPSYDKLPWVRNRLPLAEGPFEKGPQPRQYAPLVGGERTPLAFAIALGQAAGVTQLTPGQGFASREFSRLGLSPFRFLRRDPDPSIDRAQWKAMSQFFEDVGKAFEKDSSYQAASDAEKAARWEDVFKGDDGLASAARTIGEQANPEEMARREILKSVGPLRGKAIGLDKKVQEMRKQQKESRATSP